MYFTKEVFLLIFCFLKEIISTPSHVQDSSTKDYYDITTTLNNSIVELLQENIDAQTVRNLIEEMKYHRSTYEMENTLKQEPFQDIIFIHNIEIRRITSDKLTLPETKGTNKPSVLYNFTTNELEVWSTKLSFRVYGYIGIEPKKTNAWFRARLEYKDARVIIKRSEEKFSIGIKGDLVDNQLKLQQWDYDDTNMSSPYILLEELIKGIEPSSKVHISQNVQETLINKMRPLIPSLILDNINANKKLMLFLNATFHQLPTQNEITSSHTDLMDNKQQYYFFIPKFSVLGFDLSNIKIRGLRNYNLLLIQPSSEIENANRTFANNTVVLKNIEGSMNWNHGLTDVPPLKMNFSADQLSVTFDEKRESISVRTLKYRVTGMSLRIRIFKGLHLSKMSRCTELLFGAMVGSSIMPSIRSEESNILKVDTPNVYKETLNWFKQMVTDTPPKQLHPTTTKSGDIKSHKQILTKKQSKFRQTTIEKADIDSSSISSKEKTFDTEDKNHAHEPYNYHISFPNITIRLVSTNPQAAKQIQCEFFNNSQITRHIDAALTGTLHLNGSKTKSLPINFHCDFKAVNFSIIKPDDIDKNGTCEFQLNPDQDIEVELSSTENATLTEDELNIKRKIDAALITMTTMKQRIVKNMKSIVCYPLDMCSQSVKLVDDFVSRFIDNLLRKCLLRKDEITIT